MECKNIYLLELLVGIRYINLDVKYKRRINAGVHVLHECAKSEYVFEWVVIFLPNRLVPVAALRFTHHTVNGDFAFGDFGRHGLGFNSIFNISDLPSILSQDSYVVTLGNYYFDTVASVHGVLNAG